MVATSPAHTSSSSRIPEPCQPSCTTPCSSATTHSSGKSTRSRKGMPSSLASRTSPMRLRDFLEIRSNCVSPGSLSKPCSPDHLVTSKPALWQLNMSTRDAWLSTSLWRDGVPSSDLLAGRRPAGKKGSPPPWPRLRDGGSFLRPSARVSDWAVCSLRSNEITSSFNGSRLETWPPSLPSLDVVSHPNGSDVIESRPTCALVEPSAICRSSSTRRIVHAHVCMCARVHVCMCACVQCVHVPMCARVYVHMGMCTRLPLVEHAQDGVLGDVVKLLGGVVDLAYVHISTCAHVHVCMCICACGDVHA